MTELLEIVEDLLNQDRIVLSEGLSMTGEYYGISLEPDGCSMVPSLRKYTV